MPLDVVGDIVGPAHRERRIDGRVDLGPQRAALPAHSQLARPGHPGDARVVYDDHHTNRGSCS